MRIVEVHSDGSSNGRSGSKCGWGYILLVDGVMKGAGFGHIPSGTNNVAELTGALEGLKHAYEVGHRCLTLVSDSEYTLGMTNRSMVPNKNLELVEEIRTLTAKMQVVTRWVPGHSTGGPDESINQWCDLLAKEGKKSENLF